jgi:DNA-binding GntR family transcriptional regulator
MSSARRKLKRPGQTADQIFQRLIEGILSGVFPSGSVVRESRLARQWRISRTPLREAMRRAAETGFIVLRPNQAPIIRRLTVKDIRDLYDLRLVLELHALELAWPHFRREDIRSLRALAAKVRAAAPRGWAISCLQLDLALHGLWIRRCGNSWLGTALEWHYRFLRIFQRWIGKNPASLAKSYEEHLAILAALERGDRPRALAQLRQHIEASAKLVEEALPANTSDQG